MIEFVSSFFSMIRDILQFTLGLFAVYGGSLFFVLTAYDIFCPIGKEIIYFSEEFRKEKKSLRWNRRK